MISDMLLFFRIGFFFLAKELDLESRELESLDAGFRVDEPVCNGP